jgi:hypothetical protein
MSKNRKTGGVKLSTEDQSRMARLREEIISRISEMNLIVARNLNKTPSISLKNISFAPVPGEVLSEGGGGGEGSGGGDEGCDYIVAPGGCYNYCEGICYEC